MNNNSYKNQKVRGLKRKCDYILNHGGKCEICGYNKNIAALDFHHRNPEEKEFQIDSRKFANCNLDVLQKELDKCIIVCANCHRELHHPDLNLDTIINISEKSNKKSFSNKEFIGSICPVCGKKFKKVTGKIYCSAECREKSKNYPSKVEVEFQYSILHSWKKVAEYFNITAKTLQGIRKK